MEYIVKPVLGKILKERNMTQTQLSNLTGIPQGTISKFDRNKQHQDAHLIAISRALDLAIEELFEVKTENKMGILVDMRTREDVEFEFDDLKDDEDFSNNLVVADRSAHYKTSNNK